MAQTKTAPKRRPSGTRRPVSSSNGTTNANTRRIDELGDDLRDAGRKASRRLIKAYESTWDRVADLEDKVADKSRVDWITDVARAQARITRKVSSAYSTEARKLVG